MSEEILKCITGGIKGLDSSKETPSGKTFLGGSNCNKKIILEFRTS